MAYTKKQIDEITEILHEAIIDSGNKCLKNELKSWAVFYNNYVKKEKKNENNTKTH